MKIKFLLILWSVFSLLHAQEIFQQQEVTNRKGSDYRFSIIKHLDVTPVKNQYNTGTCWSFSGLSFLESEIIRLGHGEINLSEMWVVRNAYLGKAKNYLRTDGHTNFGQGGLFHDNIWVLKHFGLVPEYAYPGLGYGEKKHNHNELHAVLYGMLKALNKNRKAES